METLLNLVWLGITVAAVWLWQFRWTVSRQNRRHSSRLEAAAMVCALALLFPVISLTDDLHPEIFAVDSVSGKRNACLMAAASLHARDVSAHSSREQFIYAVLSKPFIGASLVSTQLVLPPKFLQPAFLASTYLGRSPPSFVS